MTHSERIERIARAMCVSDLERLFDGDELNQRVEYAVEDYRRQAEAAYLATLESLREPSEGMKREAKVELWECEEALTNVWRAMLDAAIKEAE